MSGERRRAQQRLGTLPQQNGCWIAHPRFEVMPIPHPLSSIQCVPDAMRPHAHAPNQLHNPQAQSIDSQINARSNSIPPRALTTTHDPPTMPTPTHNRLESRQGTQHLKSGESEPEHAHAPAGRQPGTHTMEEPQLLQQPLPSPSPFFGDEAMLDLSGLDEDMLFHLLDDDQHGDGEMQPPQQPLMQQQEAAAAASSYAPPPQQHPPNATSSSSPPLAPLPLAGSTQPSLPQPRPLAPAATIASRPPVVGIAPSLKSKGPLILPRGYTTGTTAAAPPIAPRPVIAAAPTAAGVKRKASSSSSSSSTASVAAASVDEKQAVAMEVERAVAALEEQVIVGL